MDATDADVVCDLSLIQLHGLVLCGCLRAWLCLSKVLRSPRARTPGVHSLAAQAKLRDARAKRRQCEPRKTRPSSTLLGPSLATPASVARKCFRTRYQWANYTWHYLRGGTTFLLTVMAGVCGQCGMMQRSQSPAVSTASRPRTACHQVGAPAYSYPG